MTVQPGAAPQYSPDGRHYWDGTQWLAVAPTPPPPPPPGYTHAPQPGHPYAHVQAPAAGLSNNVGGFTAGAAICGVVALLFFPIVLGPIGIILGAVGISRKERFAPVGLAVAAVGLVVGMLLGILAFSG